MSGQTRSGLRLRGPRGLVDAGRRRRASRRSSRCRRPPAPAPRSAAPAVITDPSDHTKKIIFHPLMLPKVVIADPELTLDLPAKITAWTGMDALSHCLEAWCSPFFHPLGEGIALEGHAALQGMAAGRGRGRSATSRPAPSCWRPRRWARSRSRRASAAMHAMSHPCSSLRGTHHGLTNAVVMPYVLVRNLPAIEGRLAALARYLDLPGQTARSVIDWTRRAPPRDRHPATRWRRSASTRT